MSDNTQIISPAQLALPFSTESQKAWYLRLYSPDNKNRSRPNPTKIQAIREVLVGLNPLEGEEGRRLRHEVKVKYALDNGILIVKRKDGTSRKLVTDLEVFDLVVKTHINLGHDGRRKTFTDIDRDFYGISRQEVEWILDHCATCAVKKTQRKTAPLKPIIASKLFERVQVDLIGMSSRPDGKHKWIYHIKDHFSKYSQAYPLESKHSQSVCQVFTSWVSHLRPPYILQWDNDKEFKGAMLLLVREYGIRIINGRARHPQSQGFIEQGNSVLKDKIASWMRDYESTEWTKALPEAILAMNSQRHSVTQRAPYEIVFGQRPHGDRVLFTERHAAQVEDESTITETENELNRETSGGVPIDPQLLNVPALTRESIDIDVREATLRARHAMIVRDGRVNQLPNFQIDDMVTLKIPPADRLSSGVKRLICRILAIPSANSFTLMSEHAIISRPCAPQEMEPIPNMIQFKLEKGSGRKFITIRRAIKDTENRRHKTTVTAVSCLCMSECKSQACPSFRAKLLCSVDCHLNTSQKDCNNLDEDLLSFSDDSGESESSESDDDISQTEDTIYVRQPCSPIIKPVSQPVELGVERKRKRKAIVGDEKRAKRRLD